MGPSLHKWKKVCRGDDLSSSTVEVGVGYGFFSPGKRKGVSFDEYMPKGDTSVKKRKVNLHNDESILASVDVPSRRVQ